MSAIYLFRSGTHFTCDSEINALRTFIAANLVHILAIELIHGPDWMDPNLIEPLTSMGLINSWGKEKAITPRKVPG